MAKTEEKELKPLEKATARADANNAQLSQDPAAMQRAADAAVKSRGAPKPVFRDSMADKTGVAKVLNPLEHGDAVTDPTRKSNFTADGRRLAVRDGQYVDPEILGNEQEESRRVQQSAARVYSQMEQLLADPELPFDPQIREQVGDSMARYQQGQSEVREAKAAGASPARVRQLEEQAAEAARELDQFGDSDMLAAIMQAREAKKAEMRQVKFDEAQADFQQRMTQVTGAAEQMQQRASEATAALDERYREQYSKLTAESFNVEDLGFGAQEGARLAEQLAAAEQEGTDDVWFRNLSDAQKNQLAEYEMSKAAFDQKRESQIKQMRMSEAFDRAKIEREVEYQQYRVREDAVLKASTPEQRLFWLAEMDKLPEGVSLNGEALTEDNQRRINLAYSRIATEIREMRDQRRKKFAQAADGYGDGYDPAVHGDWKIHRIEGL